MKTIKEEAKEQKSTVMHHAYDLAVQLYNLQGIDREEFNESLKEVFKYLETEFQEYLTIN